MKSNAYTYPLTILETYLDMLGHMNHAIYLTLFEEARWELVTERGFGLEKMMETGVGPAILEIKIRYLKEIKLRDQIIIETELGEFQDKIGKMKQRMLRGEEVCCTAEFTFGMMDLKERKLVMPPAEWLKAVGRMD